jgi:hypothetical protein
MMLSGIPLKGRAGGLPWAHNADCDCEAHHTFTCNRCGRRVGWCLGAADNMPSACDFCWKPDGVEVSCAG